jgi:Phage integrase family.
MRSCEYSKTSSPSESRTTRILTIGNIRFFRNQTVLSHNDPDLASSDIVSITFVSQKNKAKFQTISMHRSGHPFLCPVHAWASIVQRIRNYSASNDHTPVNIYLTKSGRLLHISSNEIRTKLRAAAAAIGAAALGFSVEDIGCHSLRSGSAMAMYLAGVPVTTIQRIGRWKSDAFLRYIREQVDCFTTNVSTKMVSVQSFFTIPDPHSQLLSACTTGDGLFHSAVMFSKLVLE